MNNYPQSVLAAKAVSTDKKRYESSKMTLAEAILREIPPRKIGRPAPGTLTVDQEIAALTEQFAADGVTTFDGSKYTPIVLSRMRLVAAWVDGEKSYSPVTLLWQPVAWNVHFEAWAAGMAFDVFVGHVEARTIIGVDSLRRVLGKRTTRAITTDEKVVKITEAIAAGELDDAELATLAEVATAAIVKPRPTEPVGESSTVDDLPFGGEFPKVPGEDVPVNLGVSIQADCVRISFLVGVLHQSLDKATPAEIDYARSAIVTMQTNVDDAVRPYVVDGNDIEEWLRETTAS